MSKYIDDITHLTFKIHAHVALHQPLDLHFILHLPSFEISFVSGLSNDDTEPRILNSTPANDHHLSYWRNRTRSSYPLLLKSESVKEWDILRNFSK